MELRFVANVRDEWLRVDLIHDGDTTVLSQRCSLKESKLVAKTTELLLACMGYVLIQTEDYALNAKRMMFKKDIQCGAI